MQEHYAKPSNGHAARIKGKTVDNRGRQCRRRCTPVARRLSYEKSIYRTIGYAMIRYVGLGVKGLSGERMGG